MSNQTGTQTGPDSHESYKYWAFISYSHQDEAWVVWLHRALETYKVPRRLVGRKSAHGEVPRRAFPIFRDRDELPGASDLGGNIKSALRLSRSLIVICSPRSAVSKWVNEEVKTYKALGREDRVFCLIVDGEPNASDKPELGLLECFPPAVRHHVGADGQLTHERTEPIAADARKGKDGRTNAKLKLLSGIVGVGYDELKQREKQRIFWHRVRLATSVAALVILMATAYLAVTDAGLNLPGGEAVRTFLDRHEASLFRPVRSESEIRRAAALQRRTLFEAIRRGRTQDGWMLMSLKPKEKPLTEVWSHSQAMFALFRTPDASEPELRGLIDYLETPFAPGVPVEVNGVKYGWISHPGDTDTLAEPALWTVAALSAALGRPALLGAGERERLLERLAYTQEILKTYRPLETGGWNMFSNQKVPAEHKPYTTTLALLALLETRRADLPWAGSAAERDRLIRATAQWLVNEYDDKADPPGWHGSGEAYETFDGLTLQIYAVLLQAEAETGFPIPPVILNQIPRHLARCVERDLDFPVVRDEFSAATTDATGRDYLATESIGFLWHPWAISAAARWLARAEKHGAPAEDRVRVRRALGHLVVDLGEEAVKRASTEWTFIAAETLYGMGPIPPP